MTTTPSRPAPQVATPAHAEDWHLALVVRGEPGEGFEITNGDPEYPHGCVTPFVFSRERAVLMTAAPAMYRALQEILKYEGGADHALDDPYVMDRARSALAIAQGAAPAGGANPEEKP